MVVVLAALILGDPAHVSRRGVSISLGALGESGEVVADAVEAPVKDRAP
jgi:hypothetical protein